MTPNEMPNAPLPPQSVSVNTLLDQAYDDYCNRAEAGEAVQTEVFLEGYPTIRSSLGRLIELHHNFEQEALREAAVVWPKVGDFFHGFQLDRHLGDGASSRVFLAREKALGDRQVAVKITRSANAEAYTLGRVNHPNVIGIHSSPKVEGQDLAIICMEYKGSATLCSLLDRVLNLPKPPKDATIVFEAARDPFEAEPIATVPARWQNKSYEKGIREFFGEVCSALEYLHGKKILHRDLKPSNILMRPDGSPVLLDFNLARDPQGPGGRFGGTYQYMPPEQLLAMSGATETLSADVDERSDIFAVGMLLWETLTGKLPFGRPPENPTTADYLALQAKGFQAPLPKDWTVSPDLVAIVRRCLSTDPKERPASAAELRRALVPQVKKSRVGMWASLATAAAIWGLLVAAATGAFTRAPSPAALMAQRDEDNARRYRTGVKAFNEGRADIAYNEFDAVLKDRFEDPRALRARALATVKDETDDVNRARIALDDVSRAHSRDPRKEDLAYLAFLSQMTRDTKGAKELYKKAIDEGQDSAAIRNNLAVILSNSSNMTDAGLEQANEAVRIAPTSPQAFYNRGWLLQKQAGDSLRSLTAREKADLLSKSLADYLEVLKSYPDNGQLHLRIAQVMAMSDPPNPKYIDHLRTAIDQGFPGEFRTEGSFAKVRGEQDFQKLAAAPSQPSPLAQMKRLIPPRMEMPNWE